MRRRQGALAVLAVALPLAIFAGLAIRVVHVGTVSGDRRLVGLAEDSWTETRGAVLERLLEAAMVVGGILAVAALVVLVVRGTRAQALYWALALGGLLVLEPLLKEAFQRPSVGDKPGYSFPSGNAMASAAIVVATALVLRSSSDSRRVLAVGIPLVLVYGGLLVVGLWHHPSDVVAGWCIGVAWATALWLLVQPTPAGSRSSPRRF